MKILSKGIVKENIIELITIDQKLEMLVDKKLERPVPGFKVNEKVGDIHNEIFLLVIMMTMPNFDFLRILIEKERSSDIMYAKLFMNLGLKMENDRLM